MGQEALVAADRWVEDPVVPEDQDQDEDRAGQEALVVRVEALVGPEALEVLAVSGAPVGVGADVDSGPIVRANGAMTIRAVNT